jgi:hypothetical protein
MKDIIKYFIKLLADLISYLKNKQLIDAGKNEISNRLLQANKENEEKIQQIKNNVSNMPIHDVERMLNIKITDK